MRRRGGISPVTLIWGVLLLLAAALGGAAIWMVQRRHGKSTLMPPGSGSTVDSSGDPEPSPPAESSRKAPEIDIRDGCELGAPDCELVWVPDGAEEDVEDGPVAAPPLLRASQKARPLPAPAVAPAPSPSAVAPSALRPDPPPPATALAAPVSSVRVPRDAALLPPARPLPNSDERSLTSEAFEGITARSMQPPRRASDEADPALRAELESRLVIIVGMGVHSGSAQTRAKILAKGVHGALPLFEVHVPTFLPVAQPNFIYRFYLAFDHNDEMYEKETFRQHVEAEFYRMLAAEDAKRWHPEGYVAGTTVDASTLLASIHWVHCNYAGKPSWAHSDAIMAGYKEGGDYAFRMNDDTSFPPQADWAERFIAKLRSAAPVSNFGAVGPHCEAGPQAILTHDFTHRTHAVIFGYHYPRSLPNWSSDDWVSYVYKQYGFMHRMHDVTVVHHMHGQRYSADDRGPRLRALNAEVAAGAQTIDAWVAKVHGGIAMPHHAEEVTCC